MRNLSAGMVERLALDALAGAGCDAQLAQTGAKAAAFLESVGYPGLSLIDEALADRAQIGQKQGLVPEYGLLDTKGISCLFLGPELDRLVKEQGRIVLMRVRHGLFLVPWSIWGNYAIGCPVDPSFALGGPRERNPYAEKIAKSAETGIEVDEAVISRLAALSQDGKS